jgi:UDP-N-acetylmuramate--alanine ligase
MGVGGAGCSAVFAIAHHFGYQVSGCDNEAKSIYLDHNLAKLVSVGHSPDHLKGVDLLVYSPAIPAYDPQNEELLAAKKKGIETVPWEQFVSKELLPDKFVIAVAGTHGKSTVTAMVAAILEKAGLDPTCLVGAVVDAWGRNYRVGKSKYFIIEADEYSEKFLLFPAAIAAITNIEFDHPEYFGDFENLKEAFGKFVKTLKKRSILITGPRVELENPNGETIKVSKPANFNLKMVGEFNQLNAAVAAAVAEKLGVREEIIKKVLESFSGLARRFEFKGEEKEVLVFDDYAHHPTAVLATAKAAREKFPNQKIWLVFQPHLYSRTKALFKEFIESFKGSPVDEIIITDIFGAREKDTGEVSSADLVRDIKGKQVKYLPSLEEAATYITKETFAGDVVVTMGAGDIYKLPELLLKKLENKA